MVIIVPTEATVGVTILILLPYFIVVVATIIYTHKKLEKNNYNDNTSKGVINNDNND